MKSNENRRFYWLQLSKDFFLSKEMKLLRKIAGGDTHTIIYLKMMVWSLENNGIIYFDGVADNLAEELSLEIDENIEDIKITLIFLESKGLITKGSDDSREYQLEQVPELTGSETASTRRSRKHRENQKMLQRNTNATKCNVEIEKEIEKELDIELESEVEESSTANVNPLKIISDYYQQEIGVLSPNQFEQLSDYLTHTKMEVEVVKSAITKAADNGKRSFGYINSILRNWRQNGITTMVQVKEEERMFIERKAKKANQSLTKSPQSTPEWSNPDYKNETTEEEKQRLEKMKQDMLSRLGGDD
ncbi:DnaD domain protein [Streptococcus sp. S784/96/1]|uniref:DnaD domain protein n=1 Tax=Streptococcus sp. S784/96/1 TaxID=2653499 RepID=UPI0030827E93